MTTKRLVLVLVAGVAAIVAAPLAASVRSHDQDDDSRLVLIERMQITSFDAATGEGVQAGMFVAAGAVNDAGPAEAHFRVTPGTKGLCSPGRPHTFIGSAGTITVLTKGVICPYPPTNPPRAFASGSWRVVGGTGAYDKLHGRGKVLATADFASGQITIAREGDVERND